MSERYIIDYKIIADDQLDRFYNMLYRYLDAGYILQGGASMTAHPHESPARWYFTQAVIRPKAAKKKGKP